MDGSGPDSSRQEKSVLEAMLSLNRRLQKMKHREYRSLVVRLDLISEIKKALGKVRRQGWRQAGLVPHPKEEEFASMRGEKVSEAQSQEIKRYLERRALKHRGYIPMDSQVWDEAASLVRLDKATCMLEWYGENNPFYKKAPFTPEEDKLIMERSSGEWALLSETLGRSPQNVFARRKELEIKRDWNTRWTKDEDEQLLKAVGPERRLSWTRISSFLEGKSPKQCMYRYTRSLCPGIQKGKWTSKEDEKLLKAVAVHKKGNWKTIQKMVPGRSDFQCRERYLYALDPEINHGKWTPEEDARLLALVERQGARGWSRISEGLGGRTDRQCRKRHSILKRRACRKDETA
jgi:Myb-like DNA-binding domain